VPFAFYPAATLGLIGRKMRASAVRQEIQRAVVSARASLAAVLLFHRYGRTCPDWQVLRSEFDQMLIAARARAGPRSCRRSHRNGLLQAGGRAVVCERGTGWPVVEYFAPDHPDWLGQGIVPAGATTARARPKLNKVAVWLITAAPQTRKSASTPARLTVAFVQEKGWFWVHPAHQRPGQRGRVAEANISRAAVVRGGRTDFQRRDRGEPLIKEAPRAGRQTGPFFVTNEFSFHAALARWRGYCWWATRSVFLDPIFSSAFRLMFAQGGAAPTPYTPPTGAGIFRRPFMRVVGATLRHGIENMRKLVYASTIRFQFRALDRQVPRP